MHHPLHAKGVYVEARARTYSRVCVCVRARGVYEAASQGVKCLSDALIAGERREAF